MVSPQLTLLASKQTTRGPLHEDVKKALKLELRTCWASVSISKLSVALPLLKEFPSLASYLGGSAKTLQPDKDDRQKKVYTMSPEVSLGNLIRNGDDDNDKKKVVEKLKNIDGVSFGEGPVVIPYEQLSYRKVFELALPETLIPSAFEQVGHLIHLNLKESQLPYRYFIGAVLVDKVSTARTVVNKIGNIENEFRVLPMECIGGEEDYVCTVSELGCKYCFDFSKVYWNSRLSHEHEHVVNSIPIGTSVADVFGGVGPFAIPLGVSRKCKVYANDLNPNSYQALVDNIKLNKIGERVIPYNLDGRDFIKQVAVHRPQHYIMNLPAIAISFLNALAESDAEEWAPTVHVHCFSRASESLVTEAASDSLKHPWSMWADVVLRLIRVLYGVDVSSILPDATVAPDGSSVDFTGDAKFLEEAAEKLCRKYFSEKVIVRIVRNVSPRKTMCCAEFVFARPSDGLPPSSKHQPE